MILDTTRRLALACMIGVMACSAQTPTVQDLQYKLLRFEEESQKTIAELKAEIAALQQGQKSPSMPAPPSTPVPKTSPVPQD
ncbi:MAG: hypothetical protein WBY44_25525, partial [Bryobacteraceae bacterium]